MRVRQLAAASLVAAAFAASYLPATAQQPAPTISFVFATQAGSGVYSIEGRIVQIYRIPVEFPIRKLENGRSWGVQMTLPATLGFYDYNAADAIHGDFPDHVGTASLLPGVRFDVQTTPHWVLSPGVELGVSRDFTQDVTRAVYDVGLRSEVTFPAGTWDGRAGQRALWAGAGGGGEALADSYAEAQAGFEFRHELPWRAGRGRWDIGPFVTYTHYFKRDAASTATVYAAPATSPGVNDQWEIGVSFGTRPKLAWWKVSMPNLGLSYRFGDGISGVRFIIGASF